MKISLQNAGKRFGSDWIFRHLNLDFEQGTKTALLGSNGSGKSTLLRVCSAYFSLSEGSIDFHLNREKILIDQVYSSISIAAPYLELPGLFNLQESIEFHFNFKTALRQLSAEEIIELSGLADHRHKQIKHFSSGMKQRLKLILAICTESSLLLLDEPSTNLDAAAIAWYNKLLHDFSDDRTIIIASNHSQAEFEICNKSIELSTIKTPQV